jgi:UDP-N-acetylmuramate dehydrogenase
MKVKNKALLAEYTSFGTGGPAEHLVIAESTEDLYKAVKEHHTGNLWILGYGTNVLISDHGLQGTTIVTHRGKIERDGNNIIADAGVWWDDLVKYSIDNQLWGVELMSGIPGGVGGAVFININAYGQSVANQLEWIEIIDSKSKLRSKLYAKDLQWNYKQSVFQSAEHSSTIIIKASFKLSSKSTCELTYQKAMDVAHELGIKPDSLQSRRKIVLEAREQAGSIYIPGKGYEKTVGSFFRNPLVTKEQAEFVINFDESGKTKKQILAMNKVHGGTEYRVSAAHVLLACGFSRGQSWGGVRLHPKNLLKIENYNSASAQEIYNVSKLIQRTAEEKLGITLDTEVRILGDFS